MGAARWISVVFVLGVMPTVVVAQKPPAPQDRIAVIVRAGGDMGGFTDPNRDREEGRRDVAEKLSGSKWVQLVPTADKAIIVVDILGREDKREERTVLARLTVGGETSEMTGRAGVMGGKRFGRAAGQLADQIDEWVKANYSKLFALRK